MTRAEVLKIRNLDLDSDKDLEVFYDVFISAVQDITGVTDAAGVPLTKQEIVDSAFFIEALTEAAREWTLEIQPKNSGPSAK
jgi:hypothetical protein